MNAVGRKPPRAPAETILDGMDGALDLLGNRRILERIVDIGVYEFFRCGTILIGR
ncbi:MAG: hypothetical protein PHW60_15785 [Kiritimatiellae bacterium]|nr:hypothetical protein [Kiritimatiellia bacterium]